MSQPTQSEEKSNAEILQQLEDKIKEVEEAMAILEGNIQSVVMYNESLKLKLLAYLPVTRKRIQINEVSMMELTKSMLQIQRQVFQIIKTLQIQAMSGCSEECKKGNKEGDVMYG